MWFAPYAVSRVAPEGVSPDENFLITAFSTAFTRGTHYFAREALPTSTADVNMLLSYFDDAIRESTAVDTAVLPDLDRSGAASLSSKLAAIIIAERSHSYVDAESVAIADAAQRDAIELVQLWNLEAEPHVMFSDDGILTLQWQHGEHGVALIFAGDGMASIAFRKPWQFYAENGIEVAISDDIPRQFTDALAGII
jgi:hypothetical protein